ncbi:hypothetical protein DYB26_013556 [Aphanomyces astaci]|uniref:HTH CENPB-type domain-containing protein n=1 Tax=Aphanomyces astaci TaxID=112090 RepID=A0A397EZC5_APHAT|nr:hypothetical protein DYB31_008581 [Aphanomyces astaci]RHZ05925.1 hypothetical protein DYB26_013556 [Aphanomyces astaci]
MLDSDDHPAQRRPSTGRPVFKYGPKKTAKQFKNTVVSYNERLSVIQYYDTCGMQATLNAFYNNCTMAARETMRKKVYSWVANRDHITRMAASPATAKLKCWRPMGTGMTLTMEAEEQLAHWVLEMRKDGVPVAQAMIRIMALESIVDLGLEDHEFLAGWHCVHGFKRQDWIAVLEAFAARVDAIAKENDIDVIYNADQTAVNYEYLPTKTINKTGEKTIWVKCGGKTKERVTDMLLADSTGTKHPLFLVM